MNDKQKKTFVIASGFWSTNIGNAFFNLGAEYQLKKVCPDSRVEMLSDRAAYWDFFRHETPKNSFCFLEHAKYDYLVLQGSVLGPRFEKAWGDALQKIVAKGTKLIFLGAGVSEHAKEDIDKCRNFLKKTPPYLLVTRDEFTYNNFHDIAEHSYNGIDNAFFLPDAYQPVPNDLPPYMVVNFDKLVEPKISYHNIESDANEFRKVTELQRIYNVNWDSKHWEIEFPRFRFMLANLFGKFYPYITNRLPAFAPPLHQIEDYKIIRTDHQCNPVSLRRIFRKPDTFTSDIPYTYLSLYANCDYAITDRIHTCVISLAYGNSAMLFTGSCRSALLDRVGVGDVYSKPTCIDMEKLNVEKKKQLSYLKDILS